MKQLSDINNRIGQDSLQDDAAGVAPDIDDDNNLKRVERGIENANTEWSLKIQGDPNKRCQCLEC